MTSSHSQMSGRNPADRFTKLKGVLVNNLLKEYHKQTKQQGDAVVYNQAVLEVEKILAHNTRLTEEQLQQLQRNFAAGVMINAPTRNIHTGAQRKSRFGGKDPKDLRMSMSHGGSVSVPPGATASMQNPQSRAAMAPQSQGMQTEQRPAHQVRAHSPDPAIAESTVQTADTVDGSPSKRRPAVDEWSILVLHNDVKHLEEQKKLRELQAIQKKETRVELQKQMAYKEEQKKLLKNEVYTDARRNEEAYAKWKAQEARTLQMKQARILAEKEYEAKELARVQKAKQAQAEKDYKEQQAMINEFQRQIEAEKKAKELEQKAKAEAYQEMLRGNASVLERKKQLQDAEKAENDRLFRLQMEMADKEERRRAHEEQMRQDRLKKAERMAGELGSRAAELDAELEARIKKAQEDWKQRDLARDRAERDAKKRRDSEQQAVLAVQVTEKNKERDQDRVYRAKISQQYRSDAERLLKEESEARRARRKKQMSMQKDLDKQLALKAATKQNQFIGMSATELRINKNLLRDVIEEKDENDVLPVPDDIVQRIKGTELDASPEKERSALKTARPPRD